MPPSLQPVNNNPHTMPLCLSQNYPHSPCTMPVGKQKRQISHFVPLGHTIPCSCPTHQNGKIRSGVNDCTNASPVAFQQFGNVLFTSVPPTCVSCGNANNGILTQTKEVPQVGANEEASTKASEIQAKRMPNVCDTVLTSEQRTWTKEGWRRQPRAQMFISILFFQCCASIMTFTMNFVHLRMPDPRKNEPLSDLLHDLVPMQQWGHTAELCMWISILSGWFTGIYVLGPYMARPSIRFALAWGSTWLLRSFVMLSTTLPPTEDYFCRHNYPNYPHDFPHPIGSITRNTLIGIATFGYGNVHCGDLMFSGHTTSLVLSVLFCYTYCRPYAPKWLFPLSLAAAIVKAFLMVAQRDHYTADVVVSAFASISFWHFAPERFPFFPGTTWSFIKKSLARTTRSTCEATDSASREVEEEALSRSLINENESTHDTMQSSPNQRRTSRATNSLGSGSPVVNGGHSPDPERSNAVPRTRARPPAPRINRGRSPSSPQSDDSVKSSESPNTRTTPHSESSLHSAESHECAQGADWDGRAMRANLGNVGPTLWYPSRCACGGSHSQAPVVYVALAPPACASHQGNRNISTTSGLAMPRGVKVGNRRGGCQTGSTLNVASPPTSPISTSSGAVRR